MVTRRKGRDLPYDGGKVARTCWPTRAARRRAAVTNGQGDAVARQSISSRREELMNTPSRNALVATAAATLTLTLATPVAATNSSGLAVTDKSTAVTFKNGQEFELARLSVDCADSAKCFLTFHQARFDYTAVDVKSLAWNGWRVLVDDVDVTASFRMMLQAPANCPKDATCGFTEVPHVTGPGGVSAWPPMGWVHFTNTGTGFHVKRGATLSFRVTMTLDRGHDFLVGLHTSPAGDDPFGKIAYKGDVHPPFNWAWDGPLYVASLDPLKRGWAWHAPMLLSRDGSGRGWSWPANKLDIALKHHEGSTP